MSGQESKPIAEIAQVGSDQKAASQADTQRLEVSPAVGSLRVDESLSGTLQAISDSGGVRGDTSMKLLISSARQNERQLERCQSMLEKITQERDGLAASLKVVEIENATLNEKLRSSRKFKLGANMLITGGGVVTTIGQRLYSNSLALEGCMIALVGLTLMAVGWCLSYSESKEK